MAEQNQNGVKKNIFLIIMTLVLILVVGALVYFLFFYDFSEKKLPAKSSNEKNAPALPSNKDKEQSAQNNKENKTNTTKNDNQKGFNEANDFNKKDLSKLASSFAERFGSYSNHSQYDNLKDLKLFMSSDMKDWAENYVQEQLSKDYSGEYYGISTKAISSKVEKFNKNAGTGEVTVQTQRTESKGENGREEVFYQDLKVDFIKEGDRWKVDEAKWQ